MKNLKVKIIIGLISFALFMLVLSTGNQSLAAITNMNQLMSFAEGDTYFSKNPTSFLGLKFTTAGFDWTKHTTGYCIDHDKTKEKVSYTIEHVIDIDIDETSYKSTDENEYTVWHGAQISVYTGTAKKSKETIFASSDSDAKAALMWSYLAYDAYETGKTSAGSSKHNFYYMLNEQWELVAKLGIKKCFIPSGSIISGKETSSYAESKEYAENTRKVWIKNKTNSDKVAINYDSSSGYSYIGPYKIAYGENTPEISNITLKVDGEKTTADGIATSVGGKIKEVSKIKSNESFYILVKGEVAKASSIKLTTAKYTFYKARIILVEAEGGAQGGIIFRGEKDTRGITISLDSAKIELGNLTIHKVDTASKASMSNIGFIIKNTDTGEYVKKGGSNTTEAEYGDINSAKTFITNSEGSITVKGLTLGNYEIYETVNPYYGYVVDSSKAISTTKISSGSQEITIENNQVYIKLSGYVWLDVAGSKTGDAKDRNDLYDSGDTLLAGITVRLKDRTTGNIIATATTDNNGAYLFTEVEIENLGNYYIEFEYDGLTYQNVTYYDVDNGSKAIEGTGRTTFNNNFASVEGGTSRDTGLTRDTSGNTKYTLNYDISTEHVSTLKNNGQYIITADTDLASYSIQNHYTAGQEEIKYINLGLYEREGVDIYLQKDLQNVKLAVNGYEHTYQYARRFANVKNNNGEGLGNVGVKFGSQEAGYTRAIYTSDYYYENPNDRSKELKVYVTYQLKIVNTSSSLTAQINSIAEYYDSNYEIVRVGTSVDSNSGDPTGDTISYGEAKAYNEKYTKTIINNGTKIGAGQEANIYIQFVLNKEAIITILNGSDNLDNVAEINSYSVYDGNGNIYAAIDTDSNPGNCTPGDISTYEDDTDSSPSLTLQLTANRTMTGKVFLDATSGELMTGEIRQGSGIYEEGETGIEGVEVTLTENSGSGKVYTATTDANGDFDITGYIPGDYTLTYTWGDETYTVQNYKGTIYLDQNRESNLNWYKDEEPRYSDAIDDYNTRKVIDDEWANNVINTTKMDSTTPEMGIGIEKNDDGTLKYGITSIESETDGNEFVPMGYTINNIDFGIVERARQVLDISKDVTGVKITLTNGQVLVDVKIVDGEVQGEGNKNVIYQGPSEDGGNGLVWAQIDNELIQGATIEIEYTINVTNKGELDYDSENYYKYGTKEGNVVKVQPTGIYDYLDSEMVLDTQKDNGDWTVVSKETYNNTYGDEKPTIIESYFTSNTTTNEDGSTTYIWETAQTSYQKIFTEWATKLEEKMTIREAKLENKTILHNANLEEALEPGESKEVDLYTSKILSNSDEIDLNNDTEITEIKLTTTTGRMPEGTTSHIYDRGETVTVTPPTGENQDYIMPIVIGAIALVILATGVIIIKKKAI